MPFKFDRLTLLANIFSLQFTEISEYQRSSSYRAWKSNFPHTFTVNFAVFAPQPRWRWRSWNLLQTWGSEIWKEYILACWKFCKYNIFQFLAKPCKIHPFSRQKTGQKAIKMTCSMQQTFLQQVVCFIPGLNTCRLAPKILSPSRHSKTEMQYVVI